MDAYDFMFVSAQQVAIAFAYSGEFSGFDTAMMTEKLGLVSLLGMFEPYGKW